MRRLTVILAAMSLAAILVACGGAAQSAGGTRGEKVQTVPVAVGVIGQLSDAGIYIAYEKGYFREQGLDIQLQTFNNPTEMLPALATDRLQVTRSAQTAGFFNSLANNVDLRIVGDGASMNKGWGYLSIVVRKDLVDSGTIRTVADLKGRIIAVNTKGSTSDLVLDRLLNRAGLKLADVQVVVVPFAEQLAALTNKAIDAAVMIEPTTTAALEKQLVVKMWNGDDVYPGMQAGILIYSPAFARNREAAKRFAVAYVKALRDYNDAFGPAKKGFDEVAGILAKHTNVKDKTLYAKIVPVGLHPDGAVNVAALEQDQQWYVQQGFVKKPVDIKKMVDPTFMAEAAKALGPYKG